MTHKGAWPAGAGIGSVVGVLSSLYDTVVLRHDMFGHLLPATFAAILGAAVGAAAVIGIPKLTKRLRSGREERGDSDGVAKDV